MMVKRCSVWCAERDEIVNPIHVEYEGKKYDVLNDPLALECSGFYKLPDDILELAKDPIPEGISLEEHMQNISKQIRSKEQNIRAVIVQLLNQSKFLSKMDTIYPIHNNFELRAASWDYKALVRYIKETHNFTDVLTEKNMSAFIDHFNMLKPTLFRVRCMITYMIQAKHIIQDIREKEALPTVINYKGELLKLRKEEFGYHNLLSLGSHIVHTYNYWMSVNEDVAKSLDVRHQIFREERAYLEVLRQLIERCWYLRDLASIDRTDPLLNKLLASETLNLNEKKTKKAILLVQLGTAYSTIVDLYNRAKLVGLCKTQEELHATFSTYEQLTTHIETLITNHKHIEGDVEELKERAIENYKPKELDILTKLEHIHYNAPLMIRTDIPELGVLAVKFDLEDMLISRLGNHNIFQQIEELFVMYTTCIKECGYYRDKDLIAMKDNIDKYMDVIINRKDIEEILQELDQVYSNGVYKCWLDMKETYKDVREYIKTKLSNWKNEIELEVEDQEEALVKIASIMVVNDNLEYVLMKVYLTLKGYPYHEVNRKV